MKELEAHPIAAQFPLMPPEELIELTNDIQANGLKHPIVMFEGKILDGRHRYEACKQARISPRYEKYAGNKPIEYCVSANLRRRHLSASQRAMIGAGLANLKPGRVWTTQNSDVGTATTSASQDKPANLPVYFSQSEKQDEKPAVNGTETTPQNGPVTQAEASVLVGASIRAIRMAAALKTDPELMKQVAEGTLALHAADAILKKRKSDAKKAAKADKAAKAALEADPEYQPPADLAPQEKKEVFRDETCWPIPEGLMPLWERRAEISDPLGMLKKLENLLKAKQAENDPLYAPINVSATTMDLQRVHMGIRAARLYAVCPICNGILPEQCNLCKGRGFINKMMWDTGIPIEFKQVRQNIIDGKKVNASTT